jgi:diacylglycerol kinase family enzyme
VEHTDRARRVVVVVNPERTKMADELMSRLDTHGLDVAVERPDDAGRLPDTVRRAADGGADTVAVVGGDGSQCSAAGVLADTGVALGVVPGGTVNLLARILGVDSVDTAAAAIATGATRTIDLGASGDSAFVLNASSGFDADVMQRVDDGAKRWGRLGYVAAGVGELRSARSNRVEVTLDGDPWYSGRAMTVMVTNFGQRGSADFEVAPGSAPDDGVLDVVVQRCDNVPTMARTLWALGRGRTPRREDLVVAHGERIGVRWERSVRAQRDGDATGTTRELQYTVRPGALLVRCPPAPAADGA